MRVAVYTAIFGSYDVLKPPVRQLGVECDFYCFSDTRYRWKRPPGWRHIHVPTDPSLHPRMQAKRLKILSHEVFPGGRLANRYSRSPFRPRYDATVWTDASLLISGDRFAQTVAALCETNALAVYAHPNRDCVFEEIALSITMPKYQGLPLEAQGRHYRELGLRTHAGLYACGVIGRRGEEGEDVRAFDEAWWEENVRWTYQDQVSFAFLALRERAKITTIPGDLWVNEFFGHTAHRSEK